MFSSDGTIRGALTFVDRAGWVLAGGRSSRMGVDKALLDLDGEPLVVRVAREAAKVCGSVSLVGNPGLYGGFGLPVIPDRFSGLGPLAGIEAALAATGADWNLMLACDMPALETPILESLFLAGGDVALPAYPDGTVEPLCAVYHRRCHPAIRSALEAGIRRITDALATLGPGFAIRYVPVTRSEPFANLNTPEDLRRYRNG